MRIKRRVVIGGLPITALCRSEWADLMVEDWRVRRAFGGLPKFMTSANGYVLSLYHRNADFRAAVDSADGIDVDGMPMVIASRLLLDDPLPERVATTDFFHTAARRAEEAGMSFFLLGASEEDNRAAIAAVRRDYPRLRIAGSHHGFFSREEEPALAKRIVEAGTDVLWVGMGVPAEHAFIVRNRRALEGVTWIKSCGGLFKFLSGKDPRAPQWLQDAGLEWLFRLMLEPGRLFKRYFVTNSHALWLMYHHRAATRQSDRVTEQLKAMASGGGFPLPTGLDDHDAHIRSTESR